ncbi:hypothetical protein F0U61_20405 [Archangium violaceum]|uniref:phage baseplate assembly protein V n=1 Tax=Archangium violaceum TaxID=83451 RepID=UPI002B319B82|nr:hypothetical protein F0U61_20405 [Archangium violaceum]
MNDQGLQDVRDILDRLRDRYFGKYRGIVTDVEEGGQGRIKALVSSVLGDQKTGWCMPCVPYAGKDSGFVFLPEVGSSVWIEFEGGDLSYPVWTGGFWAAGEFPSEAAPAKKLIRTAKGHQILLDDDGESITLTDPHGNTVTLDSAGITLARGNQKIEVTESKVSVDGGALEVS